MLLPITLIGISSTDSTGQMYIIHNHFNANMQGLREKICQKETINNFASFFGTGWRGAGFFWALLFFRDLFLEVFSDNFLNHLTCGDITLSFSIVSATLRTVRFSKSN